MDADIHDGLVALLFDVRSDMWQTLRANQCNLNGVDPLTPYDPPCTCRIGRTQIHQDGLDQTRRIIERIDYTLSVLSKEEEDRKNGQ